MRDQGIADLRAALDENLTGRSTPDIQAAVKRLGQVLQRRGLPNIKRKFPDANDQQRIIGTFTEVY